ncbi:MAG: hypothetical protein B5M48_04560 [Candidatus Omnitrophica bacterium 4484_213]|nr:MAG: hypothetical protein B5M48_04560 [Candidatus Omnitrophica bacterium 4484_213]
MAKFGGVCLKKSEPIFSIIDSAGGRTRTEPPFHPPHQKAEAERTISSFSELCSLPKFYQFWSLAANSFSIIIPTTKRLKIWIQYHASTQKACSVRYEI